MATSEISPLTHIIELMAQDNPQELAILRERVHYDQQTSEWLIIFPAPWWETTHGPGTRPPEWTLDPCDVAVILGA